MTTHTAKPTFISLHRLGELSGKARNTLLLRMRDEAGEVRHVHPQVRAE